jgi:tetratricopeptide (TPR) repeat protein
LGSAYAKFGDLKESIKYYEKSLSIQMKPGHDPRTKARTIEKLALAYEVCGNQTKAESLLRNGIEILTKTEPKHSRFLFDSTECYASYLGRQKRFAECKLWKTKAQEGIRDLIPE